jgi:hypothetical protein
VIGGGSTIVAGLAVMSPQRTATVSARRRMAWILRIDEGDSYWWYHEFLLWVEPIATVCGFIAAGTAAWFAFRVYRRDVERDEARETAERGAQASLVATWARGVRDSRR